MSRCILAILLLCVTGRLSSQPVYFRHYQVEDGLANNTVFSVFQDSRGFMWFGTKEGLNRFDGATFRTFNMMPENPQDMQEFVYCIAEGIRQTLWAGTRKGLYAFDPKTETFSLLPSSKDAEILEIRTDGKGKIWFTADQQLYCYDEVNKTSRHYALGNKGSVNIAAICMASDQTLWAGSMDGYLFRYDPARDSFHCINPATPRPTATWGEMNRIAATASGQLLIGTIKGLSSYDPATDTYRPLIGIPLQQKPVYVRDIRCIENDTYWIATEAGVYMINWQTGALTNLQQQDANPYSVSDNAVYALYKDREGGIWCGTYFGGVNYYHSRHSYFRKYFRNSGNSLSGNAIRELCADGKDAIWVGTEDAGLNRLNTRTGEISRYTAPGQVSSTNIHSLLIDGKELWVGTFQQGLDVLDLATGSRLRHYNADPGGNGLRSNFIISACKTRSRQLLFGTSHGIYQYHRPTNRFTLAAGFPEYSYVFCLYEDRDGLLWAGTIGNGLYWFDPKTGKKGNYSYDAANDSSLSSNSVCGVFEDSNQNLWISTEGGGLCKKAKHSNHFTRYNSSNGLPGNMVYKVLEDDNKNIWISTSRGLVCHDPVNNSWKLYTKSHGLLTEQFNYNSGYRAADGTLYFGSVKGLISFNPGTMQPDSSQPPVYITSFQVNNQELAVGPSGLKRSISFTDTIQLRHDQSSFTIGFAALTYIAADRTQYAYRLDGLDRNWTSLPANRKVYFTDLSPGEYVFRVRILNGQETGNSKETRILIRILPPWWLSPLAYFVYAGLAIALLYTLVSTYHRRQKEKQRRKMALFDQEKEKEIYKAKIEFFTNVAHEIRTPLTLIKGPLEMVMDEVGEEPAVKRSLKSIERNTERLVALTDQLLDFRKTENQGFSLSFVKVNVPLLVQENCQPFELAAQQQSIDFQLELPPKSFSAFIDIEAFHKIMSNLLGNAVKYAAREIRIKVTAPVEAGSSFSIRISNDGTLIPWQLREKIFEPFFRINVVDQPGSGIGLPLARALTQLHNGVLELQPADKGLNVFLLTLPVHQQIEFKLSTVQKKTT